MKPAKLAVAVLLSSFVFCTTALLIGCAEPRSVVTFLPTTYVTAVPTRATPHTRVTYHATICDSKPYRGRLAVARMNIPAGWRLDIGIFAKIVACNSKECDKLLCTNFPSSIFSSNSCCSFTYHEALGDIFIRVTSGPAPLIDWTVILEFVDKKTWVPIRRSLATTYRSLGDWPEPKAKRGLGYDHVETLTQVVKTVDQQTTTTLNMREYSFCVCPDVETGNRYKVTVSTMATDTISTTLTYVCLNLPTEAPCRPNFSIASDTCGFGINTVTLTVDSRGLIRLNVAVVCWGMLSSRTLLFLQQPSGK